MLHHQLLSGLVVCDMHQTDCCDQWTFSCCYQVIRVILLWVNNHFRDFEMFPDMADILDKFSSLLEKNVSMQQTLCVVTLLFYYRLYCCR